ncbi:MAG: Appr-1-p processing protein [candidate division Zixibacteria bacterium]|nr:Appr-1-p processing protein [candidate division Zixibacteria bacterium]
MGDELLVGDVIIEIEKGDITRWQGDAIVNAANTSLVMGAGVAGAIAKRAGTTVQREALEKAPVGLGKVARTRAGLLPAKFVIHAAVMAEDRKTDAGVIGRATKAALANAESVGLKSIAFPALGTGVGRVPYGVAAEAMLRATLEHLSEREKARLKRVVFVLYDDDAFESFRSALESFQEKS